MENTYFEYRPILSDDELAKMVDADGQPDAKAITNFYQNFLESRKPEDEFAHVWAMAEMIWSKDRSELIEIHRTDAVRLQLLALNTDGDLPLFVPEKGAWCYVFPVEIDVFFHGERLTAMLIANSGSEGDIAVVQQFEDGSTTAFVFSAAKITEEANRTITLPKSENPQDFTEEQKMMLSYRMRMLFTYHLCNGQRAWEGFCEEMEFGDEEDDPADWWKG